MIKQLQLSGLLTWEVNLGHLSPASFEHINPYGRKDILSDSPESPPMFRLSLVGAFNFKGYLI